MATSKSTGKWCMIVSDDDDEDNVEVVSRLLIVATLKALLAVGGHLDAENCCWLCVVFVFLLLQKWNT